MELGAGGNESGRSHHRCAGGCRSGDGRCGGGGASLSRGRYKRAAYTSAAVIITTHLLHCQLHHRLWHGANTMWIARSEEGLCALEQVIEVQSSTHGGTELVKADWLALGAADEDEERSRHVNWAIATEQSKQPQQLNTSDATRSAPCVQCYIGCHEIVHECVLRRRCQADVSVGAQQGRGALRHRPKVLGDEFDGRFGTILEHERDHILHVSGDAIAI
mmetsp:Transcript_16919/g.43456  ORF Transcript_16919/g.43456 Transcript_16919/m.43456 type:complete len:219 (-) Transcript_16919:62-718(-)